MPEGVEIKPKITKGGKGAKKRKGSESVSPSFLLCASLRMPITRQDEDTPSAGGESESEAETKPKVKVSTPRQKAAAAKRVKEEGETEEAEKTPTKKVCLTLITCCSSD